jgi:nicotinamide-nucleotide amidase
VEALRRRFADMNRPFLPVQEKQADRPVGSSWITNPLGTAPGILVERKDLVLAALPGVPAEMRMMFENDLAGRLRRRVNRAGIAFRSLKVAGRTEPSVDRALEDLYRTPGVSMTILSGVSGIEVRLQAEGRTGEEASSRLGRIENEVAERLGKDLYGRDGETLAEVVGAALLASGRTLATAESCTAGLLSGAVTSVPGSTAWFRGGVVVYQNDLKSVLAGVRRESIAGHGAVSREVARELAGGVRDRCSADIGLGITGIAGPSGGSGDKPVGLVHLALDDGRRIVDRKFHLPGDREMVRGRAVTAALDLLRRHLMTGDG